MNQRKLLYTFFLALFSLLVYSQQPYNKEALQKQSAQLRQEIADLNKALAASKNESKTSLIYIANLNKKLSARTQLITNTKKESRVLDDEIYLNQLEINKLKRELKVLREDRKSVV